MTLLPTDPCLCSSKKPYWRCCSPLHRGQQAPSPESVMRSRYCAYALGMVDYIVDTTDPLGPAWPPDEAAWRTQIAQFCRDTEFVGLDITEAPPAQDTVGTVTFTAHLTQQGQDASFSERSTFYRGGDGRWRYHSGERLP